jgi:16S rRNA processing protein RimM
LSGKILLGAVIGAHGIKGEVKVKAFTEAVGGLDAYGPLTTTDGRELKIASLRPTKKGEAVARFEMIATRNDAESLKGQGLHVAREVLPPPEPGEYYLADLIGLKAEDEGGALLGKVSAFHDFGAGAMVEIVDDAGGGFFLPFTDDFVPVVDIASGRIVARPPRETDESQ